MTQKKAQRTKDNQMDVYEDLFRLYKSYSIRAFIFYILTIFIGVFLFVFLEYLDTLKIEILISFFICVSLLVIFFIKSYKARYIFYKRINKLDLVEYKIPSILYSIIFLPFFFHQKNKMFQEISILRQKNSK